MSVSATTVATTTATRNAVARGSMNAPGRPSSTISGITARTAIRAEYTMGRPMACVAPATLRDRVRASAPAIAASTTTVSAMASPAMEIALKVVPVQWSASAAATKEMGMATTEMSTWRQRRTNAIRATMRSSAPMPPASLMFFWASST